MRRQAKPFTVEIKRSRKNADPSQTARPLFDLSELDLSEAPERSTASRAADRLFGGGDVATAERRPAASASRADEARNILPDLTRREPEPVAVERDEIEAEAPLPRPKRERAPNGAARVERPRAERSAAKPSGSEPSEAEPVAAMSLETAPDGMAAPSAETTQAAPEEAAVRKRRRGRARDADALPLRAGERWKRRLPRICW